MNSLDELPERANEHDIAEAAENALFQAIQNCNSFVVQVKDRSDYGTDVQLEARSGPSMTNIRVHVQLKGTTQAENSDGSVSVSVARKNLNYLSMQADSTYICYHLPTKRLLARRAGDVYSEYEHQRPGWQSQTTITVKFTELFDADFQRRLHERVIASSRSSRDWRLKWDKASIEQVVPLIKSSPPPIEVPFDPNAALAVLTGLFDAGMDLVISGTFSKFEAVLAAIPGGMDQAYMAEINLGLNGYAFDRDRVRRSIEVLEDVIARGTCYVGSLKFCQGNAYLALADHNAALDTYKAALELLNGDRMSDLKAQCFKNLGATHEALGQVDAARRCYEQALELDPNLGEAHYALGLWHHRFGTDPALALDHFDQVTGCRDSAIQISSVQGWRAELLFRLGDIDGAFREINALISQAENGPWIWPWCAKQVAEFGKSSTRALKGSIAFWSKYLRYDKRSAPAKFQLLICHWHLRMHDVATDLNFEEFKSSMVALAQTEQGESAFLWDRIGHWAQCDENWEEAERAYRLAYEQEPRIYGYCLGVALNALSRFDEALPILIHQAEEHQPDATSWVQVAMAQEGIGDIPKSIAAYLKAIDLDDGHAIAWFNLGGVYWNDRQIDRAIHTWQKARRKFPSHELASKLANDLPALFAEESPHA